MSMSSGGLWRCGGVAVVCLLVTLMVVPTTVQALESGTVLAELRTDYDAHTPVNGETSVGKIADSYGTGAWTFYGSTTEAPAGLVALTYDTAADGVRLANCYTDAGQTLDLPCIGNATTINAAGTPDADELALHPGAGGQTRTFLVARWTAGADEAGKINIAGTIRKCDAEPTWLISFALYVNGVAKDTQAISTAAGYDFDLDAVVAVGQNVDLVIGNYNGSFSADHSALSATITVAPPPVGNEVIAELRTDYDAHTPVNGETSVGKIADSYGTGAWNFYSATSIAPPHGEILLTYDTSAEWVRLANCYVDGATSGNLPAIGNATVVSGSSSPDADELALHPGYSGEPYSLLTRWTAGAAEAGEINIAGTYRLTDFGVNGNTFDIFVNDVLVDSQTIYGVEYGFDLNATVAVGQNVDIVIRPIGTGGNHSAMSAAITMLPRGTVVTIR